MFFGLYKTRHILLSDSANWTVLRAVVLTQYRRVTDRRTDGQTDGIAVASTALAMRRAVRITQKIAICTPSHNFDGLYLRHEGMYRQSEKLLKQRYLLHMSPQYGERRPTGG